MEIKLKQHLVIGIAGRATCGKTTLATLLRWHLYEAGLFQPCLVMGYANIIKEQVAKTYGLNLDDIEKSKESKLGRWILEKVGTEFVSDELKHNRIRELIAGLSKPHVIIIHDVRTIPEATIIRGEYKGIVIRLYRPSADTRDAYPSEKELPKIEFDLLAHNDHENIEHLHFIARDLSQQILQHPTQCIHQQWQLI